MIFRECYLAERSAKEFVDVIIISIIISSIFSYFLGQTADLIQKKWTVNFYPLQPTPELFFSYFWIVLIVIIWIVIDLVVFVWLFHYLYWQKVQDKNLPQDWKVALMDMFILLPAATFPWFTIHIFDWLYLESLRWDIHVIYLVLWACILAISLMVRKYRFRESEQLTTLKKTTEKIPIEEIKLDKDVYKFLVNRFDSRLNSSTTMMLAVAIGAFGILSLFNQDALLPFFPLQLSKYHLLTCAYFILGILGVLILLRARAYNYLIEVMRYSNDFAKKESEMRSQLMHRVKRRNIKDKISLFTIKHHMISWFITALLFIISWAAVALKFD